MLNIDSARIGTGEIPNEFFVRRWILIRILTQDFEECLGLRPQTRRREFLRVFLRLPGENDYPTYHFSFSLHLPIGVLSPRRIDSLMRGMEVR